MSAPADGAQTIPEALAYWAERTPDAVALLSPDHEPITYGELAAAVDRLAAALCERGLGRDDGIALLVPDGPEFGIALLAAVSVGIAVPLAWSGPAGEHGRVVANEVVRAVLTSLGTAPPARTGPQKPILRLSASDARCPTAISIAGPRLGEATPEHPPHPDDLALILRSSGTTGCPKLVPRTHGNIVANCRAVLAARTATSADRCLCLAKADSSQGCNALLFTIFTGASLVRVTAIDAESLPRWIEKFAPTYISTTPAVLRLLLDHRDALRGAIRNTPLTRIHSSAGPLSAGDVARLEAALGVPVFNGYGMSEASGIAGERYPPGRRVPGAAGPPWCDLSIRDDDGRPLGPGENGEIVVRGPTVFPGYLDDPAANADVFMPGGWFRTGDLGFLDDMGNLHLTGRKREVINRGGEKIAPREVDEVLIGHAAVAEAACFAVADTRLGEDMVAAVVLEPGTTASAWELRDWMLDHLPPFKVPRRLWFVDRLPRTATGKVQRSELARRWDEDRP